MLARDYALSLYLCNLFSVIFFPSRDEEAKKQINK